jgi:hypothetical protein
MANDCAPCERDRAELKSRRAMFVCSTCPSKSVQLSEPYANAFQLAKGPLTALGGAERLHVHRNSAV